MKFRMFFPAVPIDFPNSKVCLIGEWSIDMAVFQRCCKKTVRKLERRNFILRILLRRGRIEAKRGICKFRQQSLFEVCLKMQPRRFPGQILMGRSN